MSEITVQRSLETVTAEIVTITAQVKSTVLSGAIEIGRRLTEAKGMVAHGEWGKYLKEQVDFSPRQAENFMRLHKEYGDRQESLFGGGLKAMESLNVTSAIRMLSLPPEDREAFAAENDLASMSTRELEKAIRERNEARDAQQAAEAQARQAQTALEQAQAGAQEAGKELKLARQAAEDARGRVEKLESSLKTAREEAQKAKDTLEKEKKNPTIPDDLMRRLRLDAEKEAAEKAAGTAAEKLARLEAQMAQAEEKARNAEKALAEAGKRAALQDGKAAVFQVHFTRVQEDFRLMQDALGQIQDEALAGKLRKAALALVERLEKALEDTP